MNSGEDPLTLQRYGADAATGALALESSVALDRSFGDIAWNADETVLYGVDWTDPQHLFTIDAATGVSTDAGEILFDDGSAPSRTTGSTRSPRPPTAGSSPPGTCTRASGSSIRRPRG